MDVRSNGSRVRLRFSPYLLACLALAVGVAALQGQGLFGLSEEDEIEIGRQVAAEVEKEQPILDDPQVTAYIDRLGQALVEKSQRSHLKYQFKVVNSPDINAFAVPGGFIYVNRGLIEAADNESELAGVLGHEIGHIVGRHSADQIRRAQAASLGLRVLGGLLGDGKGAQIGNIAAQLAASGAFMKFSRDAEREADRLGTQNVYDAGVDPRGMVTFFEELAALREREPNAVETFFSSHPNPAERSANVSDLIESLPRRSSLRKDSAEFQRIKKRLATLPPPPKKKAEAGPAETTPDVDESSAAGKVSVTPPSPDAAEVILEAKTYEGHERDREIAGLFAPVFYQALGHRPRFDYATNFDFDGDWRGDNNWDNAARKQYPLRSYIYYAVSETQTHLLIHYAAFHPRDYKGGARRGVALSEVIREGVKVGGGYDPTGRAVEAVLAHENDLEGALVVAEKRGDDPREARVVFVETLAHNQFLKYAPTSLPSARYETVMLEGGRHARLYIESKGHGIEAFVGDEKQLQSAENGFLIYAFTGSADDPDERGRGRIGYDLAPFYTTLWPRAMGGINETYGEEHDYGTIRFLAAEPSGPPAEREVTLGMLGSAFNGTVGGRHMARPAWGWFDGSERDRPLGEWFFSPAETIKRHFDLDDSFSAAYLHQPFLGLFR